MSAADHLSDAQFPPTLRTSDLYYQRWDRNVPHAQFEEQEGPYLAALRSHVLSHGIPGKVQISKKSGQIADGLHRTTAAWHVGEYELPVEWVE